MKAIGFCSHFIPQGDWAFDYALKLARTRNLQLNIFHWLASPFRLRRDMVYADDEQTHVERVTEELKLRKDRELREYYDERLGDFVDVGFRFARAASTPNWAAACTAVNSTCWSWVTPVWAPCSASRASSSSPPSSGRRWC